MRRKNSRSDGDCRFSMDTPIHNDHDFHVFTRYDLLRDMINFRTTGFLSSFGSIVDVIDSRPPALSGATNREEIR